MSRLPAMLLALVAILGSRPARASNDDPAWRVSSAIGWSSGRVLGDLTVLHGVASGLSFAGGGLTARTLGVEGGHLVLAYGFASELALDLEGLDLDDFAVSARVAAFYAPELGLPFGSHGPIAREASGVWWSGGLGLGWFMELGTGPAGVVLSWEFAPGPLEAGPMLRFEAGF